MASYSYSSSNVVSNIANDLLGNSTVTFSGVSSGSSAQLIGSSAQFIGSSGGQSIQVSGGESAQYSSVFISSLEQSILRANNPIDVDESSEQLTIGSATGKWINKQEVINWRGPIPITQYEINVDSNPEIISKKTAQGLLYEQEVAIRYLRPPTPPPPGEILIKQEANIPTPPAPPLVIRQVK